MTWYAYSEQCSPAPARTTDDGSALRSTLLFQPERLMVCLISAALSVCVSSPARLLAQEFQPGRLMECLL